MIAYVDSTSGVTADKLQGYFKHWTKKPSPETLLAILKGSDHIVLALDTESKRVVGHITAISDGVSCAYIPHLEVSEEFRGKGIGSELVRRMLGKLSHLYMVDLMCDPELQPFYARFGFQLGGGMIRRNSERQTCE